MGTETVYKLVRFHKSKIHLVKFNNPLMGTETKNIDVPITQY